MFPVSMITGDPLWNSLPAAKIINYPLEKADYKPYAQARLCVSNDDFYNQCKVYVLENQGKFYLYELSDGFKKSLNENKHYNSS
jgi:hypothetical protein